MRPAKTIIFTCLNCNHDFTHKGAINKMVRCPKCNSTSLWGK